MHLHGLDNVWMTAYNHVYTHVNEFPGHGFLRRVRQQPVFIAPVNAHGNQFCSGLPHKGNVRAYSVKVDVVHNGFALYGNAVGSICVVEQADLESVYVDNVRNQRVAGRCIMVYSCVRNVQ